MKIKLKIIIPTIIAIAAVIIAAVCIKFVPDAGENIDSMLTTAQKYLVEQNYEQAIAEFNKIIELDPMNAEAYLGLTQAYDAIGDIETSIEILENGYNITNNERIKAMLDRLKGDENVEAAVTDSEEKQGLPENEYDNEGRLRIEYIINNGYVKGKITYVYSSDILQAKRESTYIGTGASYDDDPANANWHTDRKTSYKDNGDIDGITEYSADGDYIIMYEYLNGKIIRTDEQFVSDNKSVTIDYSDYENGKKEGEYIYDHNNNLRITKMYNKSGDIVYRYSEQTCEYYDDGSGRKKMHDIYNASFDSETGKLIGETFYEKGVPTNSIYYYESGAVKSKNLYDELGNESAHYEYDENGTEKRSWFMEYYEGTKTRKHYRNYQYGELKEEEYYDENGDKIRQ